MKYRVDSAEDGFVNLEGEDGVITVLPVTDFSFEIADGMCLTEENGIFRRDPEEENNRRLLMLQKRRMLFEKKK